MGDSTSSYAKKLEEGTINEVVSDLIMAKGNSGRAGYKQHSENVAWTLKLMHCIKGSNKSTKKEDT